MGWGQGKGVPWWAPPQAQQSRQRETKKEGHTKRRANNTHIQREEHTHIEEVTGRETEGQTTQREGERERQIHTHAEREGQQQQRDRQLYNVHNTLYY